MTKINESIAALYSVRLQPGERPRDARHRWEKETGRRGMVIIR